MTVFFRRSLACSITHAFDATYRSCGTTGLIERGAEGGEGSGGDLMSRRELCVIFNPAAGRGRAAARLEQLRRQWGDRVDFRPTQHPGHAEALAHQAALDGFAVVAAAGGDGTVHEVANGLLCARRPEVVFAVLPIGSANDYHHSLVHDLGVNGQPLPSA